MCSLPTGIPWLLPHQLRRASRARLGEFQDAVLTGDPDARRDFAAWLTDRGLLGHGYDPDDGPPLDVTVDQLLDTYLATWEGKLTLVTWAEERDDADDAAADEAMIP